MWEILMSSIAGLTFLGMMAYAIVPEVLDVFNERREELFSTPHG